MTPELMCICSDFFIFNLLPLTFACPQHTLPHKLTHMHTNTHSNTVSLLSLSLSLSLTFSLTHTNMSHCSTGEAPRCAACARAVAVFLDALGAEAANLALRLQVPSLRGRCLFGQGVRERESGGWGGLENSQCVH